MNGLVLDVYMYLGKPRERLVHFPYWLAYCGGKCFDLLALVLRRKFAVSAIRVRKFCQDTYFIGTNIKGTGFVPPVSLEDGLRATIEYEFIHKVNGIRFVVSERVHLPGKQGIGFILYINPNTVRIVLFIFH